MTGKYSKLTTPPNKGSNVVPPERTYKGIIHKPPVEIDDTLWFIIGGTIYKATVCLIQWTQYRGQLVTEIRGEVCPFHTVSATWDEWNKVVFRTEEEAQAMLTNEVERVYEC